MSYSVADIIFRVEQAAPPALAESWDHCGLQFGNPEERVTGVLLALDLTPEAIKKAEAMGANLILTHHPAIFSPLQTVRADLPLQADIYHCLRNGISVYSAHTNLDSVRGGVNDVLLAVLGYEATATLFPTEVYLPQAVIPLLPKLKADLPHGMVRLAEIDSIDRVRLVAHINHSLATTGAMLNFDSGGEVKYLAASGGSFSAAWIPALAEAKVDFLLSGEIKYHDLLTLARLGIAAAAAGHDTTERPVMQALAKYLRILFPELNFAVHEGFDYNKVVF